MFGYQGETDGELAGMIVARDAAHAKWPFLTTIDMTTIQNGVQLASLVKDRTGKSKVDAENDVQSWMVGQGLAASATDPSVQRWSDDGGTGQ